MGTGCSTNAVCVSNSHGKRIVSALVTPIRLSRGDAENLLVSAQVGAYVFSYDVASECFVSVSAGEYVCHHAISKRGSILAVGGECFSTINDAIQHYKTHPLGPVKLTKQFTLDAFHRSAMKRSPSVVKRRSLIGKDTSEYFTETCNDFMEKWKKNRSVAFKTPSPAHLVQPNKENLNTSGSESRPTVQTQISVSSTDFEEVDAQQLLNEPIPVLPGPNGARPPPLFPRFSHLTEELSEMPFSSANAAYDSKQALYQLYKGNPRLKYTPRVDMIKIIVIGEKDTFTERIHMADQLSSAINEFSVRNSIYCEYIDFLLSYMNSKVQNIHSCSVDTIYQDSRDEIEKCIEHQIPFILIAYLGHKIGGIRMPKKISEEDFEMITANIADKKEKEYLERHYRKDENATPPEYALLQPDDGASTNDDYGDNHYKGQRDINEIGQYRDDGEAVGSSEGIQKLFEDDYLWSLFCSDIEFILKKVIASKHGNILIIDRKFLGNDGQSDLEEALPFYLEENTDTVAERNFVNFLEDLKVNPNFNEAEQFIPVTTSVRTFLSNERRKLFSFNVSKIVGEKLQSCMSTIKAKSKVATVGDIDYDEVLYHIMRSRRISLGLNIDLGVVNEIKQYIQGETTKPMIIYGSKWSGKTTALSHVPKIASEWFNDACCIVCRFIGHTEESNSLQLMLRSICLQISYAYSTDPSAVPQDVEKLVNFLPCLFDLATDSLPLVLLLDSIDTAHVCDDVISPLMLIPKKLQNYVKMIVSLDSRTEQNLMDHPDDVIKVTLPNFTASRALTYLDQLLVKHERTLNREQQPEISKLIDASSDPVYVHLIMKELLSWKSFDKKKVKTQSIYDGIERLCTVVEKLYGGEFLRAFVFVVSVEMCGVSKELLTAFMKTALKESSDSTVQVKVTHTVNLFHGICTRRLISGHIHIQWTDNIVNEILREIYLKTCPDEYIGIMKKVTGTILERKMNTCHLTEMQKQDRFHRSQSMFSSLQRISVRFDTLDFVKKNYFLNFAYISWRLKTLHLSHVLYDVKKTLMSYPNDQDLMTLYDLLQLSNEILSYHPDQLALQVVCRLNECDTHKQNDVNNTETKYINTFLQDARRLLDVLIPCRQCLIMPHRFCNLTTEEQSNWKTKDLRCMFLYSDLYGFVCWSCEREEIYLYTKEYVSRTILVPRLQRVILATNRELVIERKCDLNNIRIEAYDFCSDAWQNIYGEEQDGPTKLAYSDVFNLFATDHENVVIGLNKERNKLTVIDLRSLDVLWEFETASFFHDVIVSRDASTVLCFPDKSESGDTDNGSEILEMALEDPPSSEAVVVLDLQTRSKSLTLRLPNDHYFGKLLALTEDGQYFIRFSETSVCMIVWHLGKGNLVHNIQINSCRLVKLLASSCGDCIVTLSLDSTLWIFGLCDGKVKHKLTEPVRALRGGYMDDSHDLCLSDDGKLATHAVRSNFHGSYIVVWNVETGDRLASLTTDFSSLTYQLSPKGDYIVSNFPVGLVAFDIKPKDDFIKKERI